MTRRDLLRLSLMAGVAALAPWRRAYATFVRTMPLQKFVQPLRGLGGQSGIPLATPISGVYPGLDYYEIALREFTDQLHPDLPGPTTLWGYGDAAAGAPMRHLGGLIAARRRTPVRIKFVNRLPSSHILPVDGSLPGAEGPQNRAVAHLHGAFVPWPSDGGPFHWVTPEGLRGPSVVDWLPSNDPLAPLNNDTFYPNDQSARLMWYHDHAIGITRLNAYAGLASGYVLRDAPELDLIAGGAIPPPEREIPLIIQDKIFDSVGNLWYPRTYDQDFFDYNPPDGAPPLPYPSTGAEFWGDTMLVNGTVFPFVQLEPRRYRLRILNACNTRFVRLRLVYAKGPTFPDNAEPNPRAEGPEFLQIGTEGGFLPAPVIVSDRKGLLLTLAPSERADVIVDFGVTAPGDTLLLYNDAPVPFPDGTPLADFRPGNHRLGVPPQPGFGPNTRTLMQFQIIPRTGGPEGRPVTLRLPAPDPPLLAPIGVMTPPPGVRVQDLTLNEAIDEYGRLMQLLGTTEPTSPEAFGRSYMSPATETPQVDAIEVWRIFNLSADSHPIHFHLVNVQVLSRQAFKELEDGGPRFLRAPVPPDPNELGWKETVRANPGECTTVMMQFRLPVVKDWRDPAGLATIEVPASPRTGGHEYVWHCHILEHEEHDMMRPLIVG